MGSKSPYGVLMNAQWGRLAPLIEAVRPRGKTQPHELRRTVETIFQHHYSRAKWRAIPAELDPWWTAAQCHNRWSHLGAGPVARPGPGAAWRRQAQHDGRG